MKYALQLYTLRDAINDKESLVKALKRVKELGFDGVEFAGYYGFEASELKKVLKDIGLIALGTHEGHDRFKNNLEELINYAVTLGVKNISMSHSTTDSLEKIEQTKSLLLKAKELASKYNIPISYHNHSHEFTKTGDILPVDELLKVTYLEMDSYWVYSSGTDPIKYLEDNKEKIALIHLKDGKKDKKEPLAIGEGDCDIKGIIAKATKLNYEWIIVENDNPIPCGLDEIVRYAEFIKKNNI